MLLGENFAFTLSMDRLIFVGIYLIALQVMAKNSCEAIFDSKLNQVKLMSHIENVNRYPDVQSQSFLPENERLVMGHRSHDFVLIREKIVEIAGSLKLKRSLVPIERRNHKGFVIDGTIDSGRRLLVDFLHKQNELIGARGVFVFIDINNLGFINKNFFEKNKTGDDLVNGVVHALFEVMQNNGYIFRLGGDEFGLVLPYRTPEEIRKFQQELVVAVSRRVHSLFRRETILRAEHIRTLRGFLDLGLVEPHIYDEMIDAFKNYARYSQEALSIGASYFGHQDVNRVLQEAEDLATQMKIVVKKSNHQDIAKYTEEKYSPEGSPRLGQVYHFPLISKISKSPLRQLQNRNFDYPSIKSEKKTEMYTVDAFSIDQYIDEVGESQIKVQYRNGQSRIYSQLDMHSLSGFVDFKTQTASQMLGQLLDHASSHATEGRFLIHINLLNLGKLNYFERKSQTGDLMIRRYAEIIKLYLSNNSVPFKLSGSEFLIYMEQVDAEFIRIFTYKLKKMIESDFIVRQIYSEQIEFLQNRLVVAAHEDQKSKLKIKISEVIALKNGSKVAVKSISLNKVFNQLSTQFVSFQDVIDFFKKID